MLNLHSTLLKNNFRPRLISLLHLIRLRIPLNYVIKEAKPKDKNKKLENKKCLVVAFKIASLPYSLKVHWFPVTGESEISTYHRNYLKISTHKILQLLSWLRVDAFQAPQVLHEDSIIKEWMFPASPKD